jgi:hypothetical protein
LEESLPAVVVFEEERGRERVSFFGQYGNGEREAVADYIKSASGAAGGISSERGRSVDACLSHR